MKATNKNKNRQGRTRRIRKVEKISYSYCGEEKKKLIRN